ncbi:MAG: signal recognition particle subunit SRP19/SEC65 family protein [Candidatus Hodarchaeota archaeon]
MLRRGRSRFTGFMIYPAYFDSKLSRKEGRKLPKDESIKQPSLLEIRLAAEKLGWEFEVDKDGSYPKEHWNKRGLIRIEKPDEINKTEVIKRLSKEIRSYIRPRLELKRKKLQESKKHRKRVYTGGKQPKISSDPHSKKQKPPQKSEKRKQTRRR